MSVRGPEAQEIEALVRMGMDVHDAVRVAVERGVPVREWLLCKVTSDGGPGTGAWVYDLLGFRLALAVSGGGRDLTVRFWKPGWSTPSFADEVRGADLLHAVLQTARETCWEALDLRLQDRIEALRIVHEDTGAVL